jgi:hypothetical protein
MSTYFTEAHELARQSRLEQARHRPPAPPRPRTRTRVAARLRRVADRLEQ